MRRFVFEVLAFLLLQLSLLAAVWWQCPRDPEHYAAAAIDKRHRITEAGSPRLIVVGGSSVSFGIDSRVIAQRGWVPVNMGHNVGLGLSFMLAQVEAHLRTGDVVVVAPEYSLLWRGPADASLVTLLEHDPSSVRYLDGPACGRIVEGGFRWLGDKLRCALEGRTTDPEIFYSRRSFDETGDFVLHRGQPRRPHEPLPMGWPAEPSADFGRALERLETFADRCDDTGARCVFAFAPLRQDHFDAHAEEIARLRQRLGEGMRLPVVLEPNESVYPGAQFYDAGEHLVEEAAAARTRALLDALEDLPTPD